MTTTRYVRDRYTEFYEVLRRQTVQTLGHRLTQFEDDALFDVQPVQFIVKDVRQTPIKLPSSSNDTGSSVQDPLQLVSLYSPRCVSEQCVAVVYRLRFATNAWTSVAVQRRSWCNWKKHTCH